MKKKEEEKHGGSLRLRAGSGSRYGGSKFRRGRLLVDGRKSTDGGLMWVQKGEISDGNGILIQEAKAKANRGGQKIAHDDEISDTIVDGLIDVYAREGPTDLEEVMRLDVEAIENELNSSGVVVDDKNGETNEAIEDDVFCIATTLDDCGIGPATIYEVMKTMSGGASKVGLPELAFKNFMKRKNQKFLGVDLQRLLEYLHHTKLCDPEFFCKIAKTEDGTVRGIFWVDGQARAVYRVFGDVLVFDTTYKKNRYHFPFGHFVGVNHHGQTTLFGCGLIADETIESFIWLFSTWLEAMDNRPPMAIITDQCPSLLRAILHVFPSAKRWYCSWHVQKHFIEHLSHLYGTSPSFKNNFGRCIYGSKTENEFETRWQELLITYNLVEHEWLGKMYKQRVHWVPLYLKGTFFAGMSSTQRSEGINYYFRGYFKQSIPLHKFAQQYENAVQRRRERETSSDFSSLNRRPPLLVGNPLEIYTSKVYTRKIFEIFKKQWSVTLVLTTTEEEVHGQKKK
ncbi:protein FAR1-RELATED SEQUENCE 5-like [Macadamia integrifolia]|uniref:protein FAR1-RELATED SEQUENCE 5-like n=1 Tax=Macadamia integrifolia TaxID=60698 RepID=UPI001C4FE51E|nr:protein FAR1-RELATED SEQUENCE 5-like [Macadamia integrifolia]